MSNKMIQEGINYLRLMNRGERIIDIASDFDITEDYVKRCIKAAREHKDAAQRTPKVTLAEPRVKVYKDFITGEMQVVEGIEVELLRDITVKFAHDEYSEFQTMLPVIIKINRKKI